MPRRGIAKVKIRSSCDFYSSVLFWFNARRSLAHLLDDLQEIYITTTTTASSSSLAGTTAARTTRLTITTITTTTRRTISVHHRRRNCYSCNSNSDSGSDINSIRKSKSKTVFVSDNRIITARQISQPQDSSTVIALTGFIFIAIATDPASQISSAANT